MRSVELNYHRGLFRKILRRFFFIIVNELSVLVFSASACDAFFALRVCMPPDDKDGKARKENLGRAEHIYR